MIRALIYRSLFLFVVLLIHTGCVAQNKSTNVQTIDGKKYYIHQIEKKQSLYAISKMYNVSVDDLYLANPELKAGAKADQVIRIPFPAPVAASTPSLGIDTNKYRTHTVAKSETVYSLTRKYNITEAQLLNYNPSIAQGLKEGQVIIVGEKSKRRVKESKENKAPVVTVTEKPPVPFVDSTLFIPVSKAKKNAYHLALILPFKCDETATIEPEALARNSSGFPEVPAVAVDFYLGFKKAMDSLSNKDFNLKLSLYDIDDKDSTRLDQIAASPEFANLDLIFGPLYASGFKTLSKKAGESHVPIVSPITQQNKILFNNIYISKTNPSTFTLLESLADYCIDSLMKGNAHVILMTLNEKDKREAAYASAFRNYFNEKLRQQLRPLKDTLRNAKTIQTLKSQYVPGVKNIVVSLSTNQVYITDFTTQLAIFADKKDVTLCGWENVTAMDNIDQEYLNQLNYTFPHQFNLTAETKALADHYKSIQQTSPSEYYYIGFDVGYYYLKNLFERGPGFVHQLDAIGMETAYMRFKFARPDTTTGFDNRGVYIFRYNNYQLLKTGWQ